MTTHPAIEAATDCDLIQAWRVRAQLPTIEGD
jgi:hypothetical protein